MEYIFLTTFYGLYFNNQFYSYNHKFLQIPDDISGQQLFIVLRQPVAISVIVFSNRTNLMNDLKTDLQAS